MRSTAILIAIVSGIAFAWMSEEDIFTLYGDVIFRPDETTLCIITSQGDTVSYVDDQVDESIDPFEEFKVVSYFPEQNYWVLMIGRWEWTGWLLLSGEDGIEYAAISCPLLSPDGTRFLCVMDDIGAGFVPNGIEIWRIEEDSLALEFRDLSVPWGPVNPKWVSDSLIEFEKMYYDEDARGIVYSQGCIQLDDQGSWIPDDPSDWTFD